MLEMKIWIRRKGTTNGAESQIFLLLLEYIEVSINVREMDHTGLQTTLILHSKHSGCKVCERPSAYCRRCSDGLSDAGVFPTCKEFCFI